MNYTYESVYGRLTMTDRVTGRDARSQLCLRAFLTDGAGQAGVKGAFPIREGIVHTLLTHRVVIMFAVRIHALTYGAHRTRLAAAAYHVEEEVVVADTDGVVGVSAGRLHPHQTCTLSARPAHLCVTVVLGVGLTCR